jgi:hypothetical protein
MLGDAKNYLKTYQTYSGIADLYVYFVEKAHELTQAEGRFGMITSNKFMRANYGKGLRAYLEANAALKEIVDFGELPVFTAAAAMPAIVLTEKKNVNTQAFRFAQIQTLDFESLKAEIHRVAEQLDQDALVGGSWTLASGEEVRILNKIKQKGIPLIEYCDGKMRRGIVTGFNNAFFVNAEKRQQLIIEDSKAEELLKPCIVGDDVRKYEFKFREKYMIFVPWEIEIEKYPSVYEHLKKFRADLEARPEVQQGRFPWYTLSRYGSTYWQDFTKPKIIYPDIGMSSRFCLDETGVFATNTTYFIPKRDFYLLAVLNSNLTFQYLKQICAVLGEADKRGRLRFFGQYMERLPIRQIHFTTSDDTRAHEREKAKKLYDFCLTKGSQDCVLGFVSHHLDAEPERSDIVHDLLAYLAEQMLEMHKAKGAEMTGFLRWLERSLGTPIQTLKNKTAIQGYHERSLTDLLTILKRNRTAIDIDVSGRAFQEGLEREFDLSVGKLMPLIQRIEQTDALIDAVVYRLYGLTEAEIGVVEERG